MGITTTVNTQPFTVFPYLLSPKVKTSRCQNYEIFNNSQKYEWLGLSDISAMLDCDGDLSKLVFPKFSDELKLQGNTELESQISPHKHLEGGSQLLISDRALQNQWGVWTPEALQVRLVLLSALTLLSCLWQPPFSLVSCLFGRLDSSLTCQSCRRMLSCTDNF